MHTRIFIPALWVLANIAGGLASSLAVYSDTGCTKSLDTIDGQNGYPDGVCTNVKDSSPTSLYKGFMFITLDDGCSPTIYQADTDSDTCSGYAVVASIATCYNTSWVYYSIDECSREAATSTSSSSSSVASSTSSSTSSSSSPTSSASTSSTSGSVDGGAIAGAVVGSVCGLGLIAAVSAYIFWFRPKQQDKKKKRQDEIESTSSAANGAADAEKARNAASRGDLPKPAEMHQLPPELSSPPATVELPSAGSGIAEAPGDKGGFELHPESHPVELPGDHEYRSSDSLQSDH